MDRFKEVVLVVELSVHFAINAIRREVMVAEFWKTFKNVAGR